MTKLLILLLLAYIPIRPPVPVVPFPYDPNLYTEVLGWKELDPNTVFPFTVRVTEPDGQDVSLQIIMTSGPAVVIDPNFTTALDPNDPDGVSVVHTYSCTWDVPLTLGVYGAEMRVEDPNEAFDARTLLWNIRIPPKINHPPVLSGWSG